MKSAFILAAMPLIISASAANATASVVLDSNPIVADGVNGLLVGGLIYNVTFANGVVDSTFDGMPSVQSNAETALESALNASAVTYVHENIGSINNFVVGDPSNGGTELINYGTQGEWQSGSTVLGNTSEAIFTLAPPTVNLLNSDVVSSVDNLAVDGRLYDVTFEYGAVDNTFAGNGAAQADAESALVTALNGTTAAFVHEDTVGSINNFIVGDPSNGGIELISSYTAGSWQTNGSNASNASEAVFSLAPIPEPATWAMMLVGLFSIGATLRRTNRKAVMQVG